MMWARVDNRLVHGQVIETWLPFVGASTIIVANDAMAGDVLQQEIMSLAIPSGIRIVFCRVGSLKSLVEGDGKIDPSSTLVLFRECRDAREAFESGFSAPVINIGNLHYAPDKHQICSHVALSKEDVQCLRYFEQRDVTIDFRCIPSVQVKVENAW